jgi:hypothetical protein
MVDNIGMPSSSINLTYNNTGVMGTAGRRLPDRAEGRPRADRRLRAQAARGAAARVPGHHLLLPAGRHRQPDPELRFAGADRRAGARPELDANFGYAQQLLKRVRAIPGVADARIQQSNRAPLFKVDVDRTQAQLLGLTTRDVTNSMVVNLAGSSQVAPTYWLNPANGVTYPIVMQTPQRELDSLSALANLPVGNGANANAATLGGWRASSAAPAARCQPVRRRSRWCRSTPPPRAATSAPCRRHPQGADETKAGVPKGSDGRDAGPGATMERAFSGLLFGLLGAVA